MTHFLPPEDCVGTLPFFLAMEEHVARAYGGGFFVWRVNPTVIIGRNQNLEEEVNTDYCRQHGIEVFRRRSGGGCVYADRGNLMISCITGETDVEAAFSAYLERLAAFLRHLGFDASRTAHNDVLIGERKVSGNACFSTGAAAIVHGTLLYDTDFTRMQEAITPSGQKLASHGVRSVRQRVANLRELGPVPSLPELEALIVNEFCDCERLLDSDDMAAIEAIGAGYLEPSFISGRK